MVFHPSKSNCLIACFLACHCRFFDTSKQAVGAMLVHFANIFLANVFKGDPCTWWVKHICLFPLNKLTYCNKQVPDSGLSLQLPRDSRTCMLWQFYTAGLIEIEYNASIFIKYQGYHEIALIPNSRLSRLYFLYCA